MAPVLPFWAMYLALNGMAPVLPFWAMYLALNGMAPVSPFWAMYLALNGMAPVSPFWASIASVLPFYVIPDAKRYCVGIAPLGKEDFMGKYKKELKRIHGKKVRKAKAQVRSFAKGELAYEKLSQRAKKFLAKKKRTEKKPA